MLLAGTDDGVYGIEGVLGDGETTATRVLDADRVLRVCRFDGVDGLYATAESGLFHSPSGEEWTRLSVPERSVYAVTAGPSGESLYAGTRPARLFVADADPVPTDVSDWRKVEGFDAVRERSDWGIPRHDGVAQVRSLRADPSSNRLVAGIEVGGVHVSEDGGETWADRRIEGFDAPHTDDVHHVALGDGDAMVASTGSGLYRSPDAGRTWRRLDEGHRQQYFREAFVRGETVYAGGAPGSSSSWAEDDDHALFECRDGPTLESVPSPTPDEVAIGWCRGRDGVLAATHEGTLLRRRGSDGWESVGSVPTPGSVRGRYLPMEWIES